MIILYILIVLVVADIITTALKFYMDKEPKHNLKHVKIEVEVKDNMTNKDIKKELAKQILESVQSNAKVVFKDDRYICEFFIEDLMEDNEG